MDADQASVRRGTVPCARLGKSGRTSQGGTFSLDPVAFRHSRARGSLPLRRFGSNVNAVKDDERPNRKYPAKMPWVFHGNRSVIVYVTVCTKDRKRVLAGPGNHETLLKAWEEADSWLIGRYVILPDHLHLFCAPASIDSPNVKAWVKFWKSRATHYWPNQEDRPIWQRDGWDRQLRRSDSYSEKWAYVRNNPVRHGLVKTADDWPYQGEPNKLVWRDP
jgi:putative transposase